MHAHIHPTPTQSHHAGSEALWVALHGFAFALVALVVGVEHLSPTVRVNVFAYCVYWRCIVSGVCVVEGYVHRGPV